MKQAAAPMSTAIKVTTGLILFMTAGFLVAAFYAPVLWIAAALAGGVTLLCYLFAPVGYELDGDRLTVYFRLGSKVFAPVARCATLTNRPPMGLRLWGNGGLFAATGIFWNKSYGIFRAYVTSAQVRDQVVVDTATQKILISPEGPEEFVKWCQGREQKTKSKS